MRANWKIFGLLLLILLGTRALPQIGKTRISHAIAGELQRYPEATLQDIYKSFFQDEFGAGHLVSDPERAREYFDHELHTMVSQGRRAADPCGAGVHFVRVPMDLVKDGLIGEEDYFSSFLESSRNFKIPEIEAWKQKWGEIMDVAATMDLQLQGFENDSIAILKLLDSGDPVVHHSDVFREAYDPHYRIMEKKAWKKLAKRHRLH